MVSTPRNCSTCGGYRWVLQQRSGVEEATPCPACLSRTRMESLLESAKIPPRYLNRDFRAYSFRNAAQERALRRSIQYVETFPEVDRGLLFVGPCGVGKTHLSVAILTELIQAKRVSSRFIDESELLRRLQHSYGPGSPQTSREILSPLRHVDLLVWDDLGTVRPTEWVTETIHMALNHRYTYNKHTILSTNRPLGIPGSAGESLVEKIGMPLVSRLMEMCEIVEIDGPDARSTTQRARPDFEHVSRGAATPRSFENLPCVKCDSRQVDQLEVHPGESERGPFLETSYQCRKCGESYRGRFFTQESKLEYAEPY